MNEDISELNLRLKYIVLNTCNVIGCHDCDLKWNNGCSATELQGRIMDLEMEEFKDLEKNKATIHKGCK